MIKLSGDVEGNVFDVKVHKEDNGSVSVLVNGWSVLSFGEDKDNGKFTVSRIGNIEDSRFDTDDEGFININDED